jgi:hypothetical protein
MRVQLGSVRVQSRGVMNGWWSGVGGRVEFEPGFAK